MHGEDIEFYEKLQAEKGQTPKALEDKPYLFNDNEEYYAAFSFLSFFRPSGFSVQAIPLTEIKAFAELYKVTDPMTLVKRIIAADIGFIEAIREKEERASKKKKRQ